MPHPGNDPGQHIGIRFTDGIASLAIYWGVVVARGGLAPPSTGYEPVKELLLYRASSGGRVAVSITMPEGTIGFQDRDRGRPAYPSVSGRLLRTRTAISYLRRVALYPVELTSVYFFVQLCGKNFDIITFERRLSSSSTALCFVIVFPSRHCSRPRYEPPRSGD